MKPLVYIAGPYSHPDPVANTRRAIHLSLHIADTTDVDVYIPHLTLLAHMLRPQPVDYWYRMGRAMVEHCHGLYRLGGESIGADIEVDYALKLGLPVFLDDSPSGVRAFEEWARSWPR